MSVLRSLWPWYFHCLWRLSVETHQDARSQSFQKSSSLNNFGHLISNHPPPTPTLIQSWMPPSSLLVLVGVQAYFDIIFSLLRDFTGWEIDIEDGFLKAWPPRWLLLKNPLVMWRSQADLARLKRPQTPPGPCPGSSMIAQGQVHLWQQRWEFAQFVHYLCNVLVVRECGCRWFIGRSRRKQIAGAQFFFLGCPWVSPPPPALLALPACSALSWLLGWT